MTETASPDYPAALALIVQASEIAAKPGMDPDGRIAALAMRSSIDVAGALLYETSMKFNNLRIRLGDGEIECAGDATKLAKDLRAGCELMQEERNRLDKLRKDVAGGVGGGASLDLAAARDEIGRRLACLRRAGGG